MTAAIETGRKPRRRLLRWFFIADFSILVLALGAFYILAGSEDRLDRTLKWTAEEVSSAVAGALDGGYSVETARAIAELAEPVLFRLARIGGDTPVMAHRRGWINVQLSRAYDEIGDPEKQLQLAQAGKRAFERAAALDPENAEWQRDLAAVEDDIGNALAAAGDLDGALRHHLEGKRKAEALLAADPANTRLKGDVAASLGKLGRHYVGRGLTEQGTQHLKAGREIVRALLAEDPSNERWLGYMRVFDRMLTAQTASGASASPPPRL